MSNHAAGRHRNRPRDQRVLAEGGRAMGRGTMLGTILAVTMAVLAAWACGAAAAPVAAAEADDGSSFMIVSWDEHDDIYGFYDEIRKANQHPFITTDLALHTGHLLFDYSLRAIEIDRLYDLAGKLTRAMVDEFETKGDSKYPLPAERESLWAYFCVAAKCLDPEFDVPPAVRERVEKDLAYMEKHEGFEYSLALDSAEDFSQYVPRGHYTRNEEFKRYFKAMMWYGRRMFRVEEVRPRCIPIPDHWTDGHLMAETRQMLMVTEALYRRKIDGRPAIDVWKALYVPTTLFAGRTEDLNPMEVEALARKAWGKLPDVKILNDEQEMRKFAERAAEFSKPKIDSSGAGRKGFCFMAQRFTPDSYITQCLVTDADRPFGAGVPAHPLVFTGTRTPGLFTWGRNPVLNPPERRFMPRGLDVMAVFGCDEALAILKADGDTEYEGYDEMLAFLRKDVGRMMEERKDENLYYGWLHALQPMMVPIESEHVPACLRSRGWLRKQLATSLASWAELRHDTILYVKQSYTPAPRGMPPRPRVVPGYVEPQPEVFRRIGRMVAKMRTDLAALGVMPEGLDGNYRDFAALCEGLAAIAEKEVNGHALTQDDYQFIHDVAGAMKRTTVLPAALRRKVLSETDTKMALVADVHTDTNAGKVLEEGVGMPFLLIVDMPLAGEKTRLHGGVFSYYEFKQPMKERLTDEQWQEMLKTPGKRPSLPEWYPVMREGSR